MMIEERLNTKVTTGFRTVVLLAFSALLAAACSSGSSDSIDTSGASNIIGTSSDVMIRGTVGVTELATGTVVEVKSSDAALTEISVSDNKQFDTNSLMGTSPWVLRVTNGDSSALYGIAYADSTRNINSFTSLNLRNWFAREGLDIDSEFNSAEPFSSLPTADEFSQTSTEVFQLIPEVINSYNLAADDIINGDYVANDEGIDAFLDANAAVIENSLVTFVVTDPNTVTQSISQSLLGLSDDFGLPGTEPPSAPNSIKAIGSADDEIIIVWEPSVDDIAVVGYQVLRNGELITTTPYPVFIDKNISSDQSFTYEIIAIDNAGNTSAVSVAAPSSTLQSDDATPPPAPTLLTRLSSNGNSVQLLWAQNQIGDVVRFNLFRGLTPQNTDFLLQVTGTPAADTTVIGGEEYCYQVSAEDANGNESDRSDVLCITASGTSGSDITDNSPLPVWVVPDLDVLVCDQQLLTEQIVPGTTVLSSGCFQVPNTLTINAGSTLRLTEGVVLKFGEGAKLSVLDGGTLIASGIPENPVVFTGDLSIRGFWGGIDFQNSTSNENLVRGAVIQFAGGATDLRAGIGFSGKSRLKMEETLIQNNASNGILFNANQSVISSFTSNRITNNDNLGTVSLELLDSLSGNSDFTGNDNEELDVPRNSFNAPITIPNLNVPISWNGVTINRGALTIEPGADLMMVNGASIIVDGAVTAEGSAAEPINIAGGLQLQGSWNGFNLSGRGDKTFDHVNISFAGSEGSENGAIVVNCSLDSEVTVAIDNTDITDSASWGINVIGPGCEAEFGENTFFNNGLGNINTP